MTLGITTVIARTSDIKHNFRKPIWLAHDSLLMLYHCTLYKRKEWQRYNITNIMRYRVHET